MKREHKAAGYHRAAWRTPGPRSKLIGRYSSSRGELAVAYVAKGPAGGAELELKWEDGTAVTVLCEDVAAGYLERYDARRLAGRRPAGAKSS